MAGDTVTDVDWILEVIEDYVEGRAGWVSVYGAQWDGLEQGVSAEAHAWLTAG